MFPYNIQEILDNPDDPEHVLWHAAYQTSTEVIPNGRQNIYPQPVTGKPWIFADSMNHLAKGLIGIVIGSYSSVKVQKVEIHDLVNRCTVSLPAEECVKHPSAVSGELMVNWTIGTVSSNNRHEWTCSVKNLKSFTGATANKLNVDDGFKLS
jgi:hypothetical protein